MIIIDTSQAIISCAIIHEGSEFSTDNQSVVSSALKHLFFNQLASFKAKYGEKYGEIVLAIDSSKNYWRRDIFPYYKGHRKKQKEDSKFNWDAIHAAIKEIKKDLKEYFRYPVIEVDGAEADDVIACLVKYTRLHSDEPILIISSDQDFCQLQSYDGVDQYSSIQDKMIKPKTSVVDFLLEHIIEGDTSDNIPNVLTDSSWAEARAKCENVFRQKSLTKSKREKFMMIGIMACEDQETTERYKRNQQLIDFAFIPADIYTNIVNEYIHYERKGSKTKLMSYFAANKLKRCFENIQNF